MSSLLAPERSGGITEARLRDLTRERTVISVFSSPSRYTQGKHATHELGNEMKTLGLAGPALIIAGRSAVKLLSEA